MGAISASSSFDTTFDPCPYNGRTPCSYESAYPIDVLRLSCDGPCCTAFDGKLKRPKSSLVRSASLLVQRLRIHDSSVHLLRSPD